LELALVQREASTGISPSQSEKGSSQFISSDVVAKTMGHIEIAQLSPGLTLNIQTFVSNYLIVMLYMSINMNLQVQCKVSN
jgi:hypothetical protein